MNDFTKEELKLLGGCVFSKFVASLNDPSIQHLQGDLKRIRDKIESMIDNYDAKVIEAWHCEKCGHVR